MFHLTSGRLLVQVESSTTSLSRTLTNCHISLSIGLVSLSGPIQVLNIMVLSFRFRSLNQTQASPDLRKKNTAKPIRPTHKKSYTCFAEGTRVTGAPATVYKKNVYCSDTLVLT